MDLIWQESTSTLAGIKTKTVILWHVSIFEQHKTGLTIWFIAQSRNLSFLILIAFGENSEFC
jgi:hypothetical protein